MIDPKSVLEEFALLGNVVTSGDEHLVCIIKRQHLIPVIERLAEVNYCMTVIDKIEGADTCIVTCESIFAEPYDEL
tara:strand:- start:359 stop:586 length:228 start_codon:yes stop_codon:yes gene_type:complete